MMEQLKQQILEKAHLNESSELARNYFKELNLDVAVITIPQAEKLSEFIQKEINILLADETYSMVRELRMHKKIKTDRFGGVYLLTDGSYFKQREAISFNYDKRDNYKFVGFCGWASGCNRIPYILGFIKLCDWMKEEKQNGN